MKKVVSTLVSAAMLACMLPVTTTAFAAGLSACDFKVTADKTAVHPGDTVTFTLTVTPTGDLYGITAGFDIPEGFTFESAALSDDATALKWDMFDPPESATGLFFGGTASKPYTAGTALVVGTITCKAGANLATGTVSLTSVAASNEDFDEIANVTSNTVTIEAAKLIKFDEKESTCTVQGNNEYWVCSDGCGKVFKSDQTTPTTVEAEKRPLKAHSFTAEKAEEKFLSTPANCKDPAKYFKSCAVCGEAKGTETFTSGAVDKTKHGDTELKNKKEATCGDKGYTGDEVCKLCGDIVKKGTDIPATEKHTGGTATCNKKAVCDTCKKEYGDVDPNNHEDVNLTGKKDPTCTEPGNTGSGTCSACGKTVEAKEIPALGHKGGTATCNQKAVCDTCKKEYGELDKNNHGNNGTEIKNAVEATETADGYTGDKVCKGCGTVLEKGTVIKSKPATIGSVTFPSSNGSNASGNGNAGTSGNGNAGTSGNTSSDTSGSASGGSSNNTSSDTGANTNNNKPSTNPATGITVTVIPMVIAAGAAVIIAKNKRK